VSAPNEEVGSRCGAPTYQRTLTAAVCTADEMAADLQDVGSWPVTVMMQTLPQAAPAVSLEFLQFWSYLCIVYAGLAGWEAACFDVPLCWESVDYRGFVCIACLVGHSRIQ